MAKGSVSKAKRSKAKDTPREEVTTSSTPDRVIRLLRDPINTTSPIENRMVTEADWNREGAVLAGEGWYRDGDAPVINPNRQLAILRKNPDGSEPQEQRVITHADWVANHSDYQGQGWYRADEARSSSRPSGT